jgi:PAS domain S-box-containing protein
MLSSISDGFFTLDDHMIVTYFNRAAEQVTGIRAEDIIGRNLFDVFSAAKGTIFEEKYGFASEHKVSVSFEAYFEAHRNWYDVRVYPFKDGISVYFKVTNARKEAEEALRMSEEKLRLLTDAVPALISYVDSEQRYRFNNKGYEDWFNLTCAELYGKHLREALGEDTYRQISPYVEAALSGRPVKFEAHINYKAGEKFVEATYVPHLDEHGHVHGFFALIIDIDERKRAEMALRESEVRYRELSENLEEKVKEKLTELKQTETLAAVGRAVSVVAHEVRNPLQSISMGIDSLKMELAQDESKAEILEEIKYGVDTLNGIISELLNYAKPIGLNLAPVRVADLVQRSLNLLEKKLRNITLHLELDRPEREITVDAAKCIQVLVNLVTNAADAMPDGGDLTIRSSFTKQNGAEIFRLSVSDTGYGIEEQNLERIFEPFFTTKTRGTGLGLAICKKTIDAHHGALRVMSEVGKGTTAEVLFPLNPPGRK